MRILVVITIFASAAVHAGVPDVITYAGALEQNGAPANGTFTAVFTLFDDATAGNAKFTQTEASLAVVGGAIVVDLGAQAGAPLDDSVLATGTLFLEVSINGETLAPRVPLNSVPFARFAKHAEDVNGLDAAGIAALNSADPSGGLVDNAGAFAIADNGVTSAKIADGTIVGDDVADNSIPMTKIQHATNILFIANAACFVDDNAIPLLTTQSTCVSHSCSSTTETFLSPCTQGGGCFHDCGAGTTGVARICDQLAAATCPNEPVFFATAP